MYLMNIEFNVYSADNKDKVQAITLEQWESICEGIVDGDSSIKAMAEKMHNEAQERQYFTFAHVMTIEAVEKISSMGIKIEVRRVKGLFSDVNPRNIPEILKQAEVAKSQIHIHVPGSVSLMEINKVTWLEDACTQELQGHLDKEWRIIAVCPANDSRRPTYILGRKGDEK